MKNLSQLLSDLPFTVSLSDLSSDPIISAIEFDSRKVKPGALFVAISGGSADGNQYISAAISAGAAAVVSERPCSNMQIPVVQVTNARETLAYLAASFYDHPARKLTVIGVTGTDGKTTTSNLIYHILCKAGIRAGLISTVNAVIGDEVIDTGFHVTTPEATGVQFYLSKMVEARLTHVVLETTSHGLAQHRVTACDYDVAVITNITHEHLDYHGSYESYRDAKARMFRQLAETPEKTQGNPRLAVLNADDASFEYLTRIVTGNKRSYSIKGIGDVNAAEIRYSAGGTDFVVELNKAILPIHCILPGDFNVSNCLAALTVAVEGLKIDPRLAAEGIADLPGVPGRMEFIDMGQSFLAIVDFAHTPNALQRALETARQMTNGKLIAVFGSAGLRDREKRRMMAAVSVNLADITILTAEDPRTESLDAILAEMADEAVKAGGVEEVNFYRVPDRGDAIRLGVKLAQPGDLVMPCGKGHEQSMCFGAIEYAWDDRIALRAAIAELLGVDGPCMPKLPTSRE